MLCVRLFEIIWSQNILVPLVSERNETKRGLAMGVEGGLGTRRGHFSNTPPLSHIW